MRERRDGVWELIVQLPRDPSSGRARQLSRTVSGTKRDAQRALAAMVAEVSAGKVSSSTMRMAELLHRWLDHAEEQLAATTVREYRRIVATRLEPDLGAAHPARRSSTRAQVEVDADLADRDYGEWAGQSLASVEAKFGSLDTTPDVERLVRFVARVTAALMRAADNAAAAPIVVVAHDAVNRHALAALVDTLGCAEDIPQRTGCWNRLERRPDGWSAPIVDAVPYDGRRP